MSALQSILLYGGTFDPVHHGHLIVCRAAAERLVVDKVVLIVSANPPHKLGKKVTDAADRLAMTQLAVKDDPLFEVSDCELHRDGPSYTLQTIRHFRDQFGSQTRLYWLIGADSVGDLPGWYNIRELAEECQIVTAGRPGYDLADMDNLKQVLGDKTVAKLVSHLLDTPRVEIAATDIRRRVKQCLSVRYLVPEAVAEYIARHRLYRD